MRARSLLFVVVLGSCARELPDGPPMPAIATQAPSPGPGDPEPLDLEPVETRRSYGARDPDPLLDGIDTEFSMVCMPSFTRSYAVALVRRGGGREKDAEPLRYSLRFAADEARQGRPIEKGGDPRLVAEVQIDETSAQRLEEAWEAVVRRTRYPRPRYEYWEIDGHLERLEAVRRGFDGIRYRFESGPYCGTTWSPKAQLPWGIVELGDALRDYALADEAQRPQQLAHCLELARALQTAAESKPW